MKKHLEFIEGTSSKFWRVETEGNMMTITYGKIGTAGKSDSKALPSADAAEKEALKQANSKIKKGYVEKDAPTGDTIAIKKEIKEPKTDKLNLINTKATNKRPIDVKDDGKPKEWQGEDYWDACYWDAETYDNLDKEPEVTSPKISIPEGNGDLSNADEAIKKDKKEFLSSCKYYRLDEFQYFIKKIEPVLPKDEFEDLIQKGIDATYKSSWDIKEDTIEIISTLLDKGAKIPNNTTKVGEDDDDDDWDDDDKSDILETIGRIYTKHNGEKTYKEAVDEYYISVFNEVVKEVEELFRIAIPNLKAGKYKDKEGVRKNKLDETRLGFRIDTDRDIEVRLSGAAHEDMKNPILEEKKSMYGEILSDTSSKLKGKYIQLLMPPVLDKLVEEGLFKDVSSTGYIIFHPYGGNVFYDVTTDGNLKEENRKRLEKQMELIATTEDWDLAVETARTTFLPYLYNGLDPDGIRSLDIAKRLFYSGIKDAFTMGFNCIRSGRNIKEEYFAPYTLELAIYEYYDLNSCWYTRYLNEILDKQDYAPAREKLQEWTEEEKLLTYGKNENNEDDDDSDDDEEKEVKYTNDDLFIETNEVIARADNAGRINIRFKEENFQAYKDVLAFLNNLMEKDYSISNDGYQMGVYFVAKPEFPKIKFHDYMPRVPELALFYKALMYEELHDDVRKFITNTVNLYDHYIDLDGEYSTVCGTFATIAAVMYDIKFIDLAILLAKETDGEHEEIAFHFCDEVKKRYGVTPETVVALYELGGSCDHDKKSFKETYTDPENLEVFISHYINDTYQFKKYNFLSLLSRIAGSSRGILKKIKEYSDNSDDKKTKTIYAEFYNLSLECLSEEDGADYGDPISVEGQTPEEDQIDIEVFEETMPVIITAEEASKRSGIPIDKLSKIDGKGAFIFHTSAFTDPYLYEFMLENREARRKTSNICTSYTCWSGAIIERLGDKWAFDLKGAACKHGMIIYDGKNKPVVLYGILDYAKIIRKLGKKTTTDRAFLEKLRVENLKMEAPKGSPVPDWLNYKDQWKDYLGMANEDLFNDRYMNARINLEKVKKDHPDYPASLLLWIRLMKKKGDGAAIKRICKELLELLPQYESYWNNILSEVK